jgi:hypothetical protein
MNTNIRNAKLSFWLDDKHKKLNCEEIELLVNEIKTLLISKGYSIPKEMCSPNPSFSLHT